MVDEMKAESNSVLNKIDKLIKGGGEKKALSSCALKYRAILEVNVPRATQALRFGDPKFAEEAATDSGLDAKSCEESFSGKSPLVVDNAFMRIVADVTSAIVKLLL
ncbi:Invertase/pectin methylesterase inhibitor domain superfamily [Sesbania bispinosa]|nr:Invertase/pectin methylesterase inhibitor domain superfamily [Sesbania bispinosa]